MRSAAPKAGVEQPRYHGPLMNTTWNEPIIRDLVARLELFRQGCRVTTLVEVERATRSPFHILVACVISLRTKDEVTAQGSARLFDLAQTPEAMAKLAESTIAKAIFPAGFYNTKARQLRQISAILVEEHHSEVPKNEADLLALPGVGRKTANVVLGTAFGIPSGEARCLLISYHMSSLCHGRIQRTYEILLLLCQRYSYGNLKSLYS